MWQERLAAGYHFVIRCPTARRQTCSPAYEMQRQHKMATLQKECTGEECTQCMLYSPCGHENYSPDTIAKPNRSQSSIPWLPRCAHVWAYSSLALDFGWKDKICMLIPETEPFDQDVGYAKKLCSLQGYVTANVSLVCVCVCVCAGGRGVLQALWHALYNNSDFKQVHNTTGYPIICH